MKLPAAAQLCNKSPISEGAVWGQMSCYRLGGWEEKQNSHPSKKGGKKRGTLKCWIRNNTISLLPFSEYRNSSHTTPSTILSIMRAQHFHQVKDPHDSIQVLGGQCSNGSLYMPHAKKPRHVCNALLWKTKFTCRISRTIWSKDN